VLFFHFLLKLKLDSLLTFFRGLFALSAPFEPRPVFVATAFPPNFAAQKS
jgi:hypothetical protein